MAVVTSYRWEEVWPFQRDHARPTTPYAAEQLAKCRTYAEPSKAHKKRLLKPRLVITRPCPTPPACPKERLRINSARQFGKVAVAAVHNPFDKPVAPKGPLPLPRDWLTPSKVKSDEDEWDLDIINARIARLAAEHEQAKLEAERVKHG